MSKTLTPSTSKAQSAMLTAAFEQLDADLAQAASAPFVPDACDVRAAELARELGANPDEIEVVRELSREVESLDKPEDEKRELVRLRFEAGYRTEVEFDDDGRGHASYDFYLPQQQAIEQIAAAKAPRPQARRQVGRRRRAGRTSRTRSSSRGSPDRPRPSELVRPRREVAA